MIVKLFEEELPLEEEDENDSMHGLFQLSIYDEEEIEDTEEEEIEVGYDILYEMVQADLEEEDFEEYDFEGYDD